MRIVCISDTHELHRELIVPSGDVLIHAGDFTFFSKRRRMIDDFNDWLGGLPHRYKIVIYGNHEFAFEAEPSLRARLSNAIVLLEELTEVEGLRVWGSPITQHMGGAFGRSSIADRRRAYANIPNGTEILVTHSPAAGILDGPEHGGCPALLETIMRVHPKLHVCGHVHSGYGLARTSQTVFANAALLGELGDLSKRPIVVDF